MKLTVAQFAIEGLVDDDYKPCVLPGHLDKERCAKLAAEYGSGYPTCHVVECKEHESAAFYASFSNEENPLRNPDGTIADEHKGHLEVWFYHVEVEPE